MNARADHCPIPEVTAKYFWLLTVLGCLGAVTPACRDMLKPNFRILLSVGTIPDLTWFVAVACVGLVMLFGLASLVALVLACFFGLLPKKHFSGAFALMVLAYLAATSLTL